MPSGSLKKRSSASLGGGCVVRQVPCGMRSDLREMVEWYVKQLGGPDRDNAWHSLRELGVAAVPLVIEARSASRAQQIRLDLLRLLAEYRSKETLPFLAELLESEPQATETWKTALDGLVMLGSSEVLALLKRARA